MHTFKSLAEGTGYSISVTNEEPQTHHTRRVVTGGVCYTGDEHNETLQRGMLALLVELAREGYCLDEPRIIRAVSTVQAKIWPDGE